MKPQILILVFIITLGCNSTEMKSSSTPNAGGDSVVVINGKQEKKHINIDKSQLTARQYATGLINGQIQPSDNDQTFAWLDSLQSTDKLTRELAFNVYKAIILKSDGALSEVICGHIKAYLFSFPKEFLDNYSKLTDKQKLRTQENIAFEFYASGTDFSKDINEYFSGIKSNCKSCSSTNHIHLEEIRIKIEVKVRQMNE